jgi:hypothetical protein
MGNRHHLATRVSGDEAFSKILILNEKRKKPNHPFK